MLRIAFIFLVTGLAFSIARAGTASPTAAETEFFESKIRPILADNCFKCHSAASVKLKGDLHLDSREGMLKGGASEEPAVVPGNLEKSKLIVAVRYTDKDLQMPPKKKLADDQIAALETWVKMGAPFPTGVATSVATTRPTRMTLEEGRKFWSFIPPREQTPPDVKSTWAKNEIDRFILAKLTEKGLTPSAQTDRRTLIRRATFDLIGLPPSAKEIDDFESDQSTGAFEKVIDRLLASPHYGERWGRYWLDVARYADTKGYVFEEERRYAFAYTYRDWVVRAFNEDLPYDQFLIQQIAADKLDLGKDRRPLAALGFLTVGRRFLNALPDIIDDRIDVVTRGTMALTVSCARCHDHKYDPIPTADYYSLYGVFASSREPKELPSMDGPVKSNQTIAFEKELAALNAEVTKFREDQHREITTGLRTPKSIANYLVAAHEALAADDEQTKKVAEKYSLKKSMLVRWRDYLKKNPPVFAAWNAFAKSPTTRPTEKNAVILAAVTLPPPKDVREVANRYATLLAIFDKPDAMKSPDQECFARSCAADSPVNVALADVETVLNKDDHAKLRTLRQKVDELVATHPGSPPKAMAMEEGDVVAPHIFTRGNAGNVGAEVPRQFPAILSPDNRQPFKEGSGRLELAKQIASKENPLTARVMVNRIWMYHFGTGIVRTPSDFGTRGEKPTHPELLDWLARRFANDDGWSIKKLHKQIMLSATYQQSSRDNAQARGVDPENRLLWRMNPRRLDFEAMRDSLLAVSGKLDEAVGGRPVDILAEPFVGRRTLYAFIDRQNLPGMFRTFDFASPDQTSSQRFTTSVPQQALFMINSPFVIEQAKMVAGRKEVAAETEAPERVERLYRTVLGRTPAKEEIDLGVKFVAGEQQQPVEIAKPSSWQYGFGEIDEATGQVKQFTPMPYFTGTTWQGGATLPDAKTGWATMTSAGGHPGDKQHAVVRRWIAPRNCTVSVAGVLAHPAPEGDGVRGRIVTPREGQLASWIVHHKEAATKISGIELKQGEAIDFIVDCRSEVSFDGFSWNITITKESAAPAVAGDDNGGQWDSRGEFAGPPAKPVVPLNPWEKYAQVLLQSNEFLFVD